MEKDYSLQIRNAILKYPKFSNFDVCWANASKFFCRICQISRAFNHSIQTMEKHLASLDHKILDKSSKNSLEQKQKIENFAFNQQILPSKGNCFPIYIFHFLPINVVMSVNTHVSNIDIDQYNALPLLY